MVWTAAILSAGFSASKKHGNKKCPSAGQKGMVYRQYKPAQLQTEVEIQLFAGQPVFFAKLVHV